MHCEDAARRLYAGERTPELEIHLSACDECRLLSEDLAGLGDAFALARTEWAPSPDFKVTLPAAPWRKLAIAACLLVLPLAGWAASSIRAARANYDLSAVFDPSAPQTPSDPQILATLFLEESSR
jgi:predicted anti-sigma-YlaC factor YlaD